MDIFNKNNYHFIGIGGIGVSAIAKMLAIQGRSVSGSDTSKSEITDELERLGIKIYTEQKAENISSNTEVVIYTVAIPEDNEEMVEAKKREVEGKIILSSYPKTLGELSKNMMTIAVSGTHGKTTTTAMIGHILEKAGFDPTIIVGSKMLTSEGKYTNFRAGKSEYLVVEACEYKRSFLNLNPTILVITNIEADHLDYYKDIDDIKNAFAELESKVQKSGYIIKEIDYKKVETNFKLLLPGKHNIKNAQVAIKAVEMMGISPEKAKECLEDFRGTWRRLEYKGEKEGNIFYDDYAHHPTEITASLSALKEAHSNRKIVAVFEPHQYSRTKLLFDDFVEALSIADYVFITPIFLSREKADTSISSDMLAEEINKHTYAKSVLNRTELKKEIENIKEDNLCVCLMGAGDIYKWTSTLLK